MCKQIKSKYLLYYINQLLILVFKNKLRPNTNKCIVVNSKINGTVRFPQRCLLARFEATFYFSRSEFTCT